MPVLDSSAAVDLLLGTDKAERVSAALYVREDIYVPDHFTAEVFGALRGANQHQGVDDDRFTSALDDLRELPRLEVASRDLIEAARPMLGSIGAYDALYVALAHETGLPLLTTDDRLMRGLNGRWVTLALTPPPAESESGLILLEVVGEDPPRDHPSSGTD